MAQFDAFPHPVAALRRSFPLAVNLRSDLLGGEGANIAAMVPRSRLPAVAGRLCPAVQIDAEEYLVLVDSMVSVPKRELPPRIANLSMHRDALLGAVDLLFYGV